MKIKKTFQGTIPENKILNNESNSQTDTYSCDYLKKRNTYSTEETFTGKYWKDGKKIYVKIMDLGPLPKGELKKYTWDAIPNINETIDAKLQGIDSNTKSLLNLPYVYPVVSYADYWITIEGIGTDSVTIVANTDRSKYNLRVWLYYTKTTD